MQKLKSTIHITELLLTKAQDLKDILVKKGSLITRNKKEYAFQLDGSYYRIYVAYGYSMTVRYKAFASSELLPFTSVIEELERYIENTSQKINKLKKFLDKDYLETYIIKRNKLVKEAEIIMNELASHFYECDGDLDVYKELLGVDYLEKFYAREY